jgi:hypothetical protein
MAPETELLLSALRKQRDHVLAAVNGLTEEQLRRRVLPSGWSLIGLVNHLALDVERFWFEAVVAGDQTVWDSLSDDSAWEVPDETRVTEVLDLYREQAGLSDAILATTALDQAPACWPDFFGDFRLADLRAVTVHVLAETACHAGHVDVVRELIDGQQSLVLT